MDDFTGRAARFRALHRPGDPILLPNAWDVASARVIEEAGAQAVATASAGVSWSLGVADGEGLSREAALGVVERVAAACTVPVTADIESGYGSTPEDVAATVRGVVDAGAVGVNLEDSATEGAAGLRDPEEQAARLAAARAVSAALFIHARVDIFLSADGDPATRTERTLDRAARYLRAGADGIFVPGVADPAVVGALAAGIDAPLGVLARPGAPRVAELAAAGAARISLGPSIPEAAYAVARRATRELLADGTYTSLDGGLGFAELNTLLRG